MAKFPNLGTSVPSLLLILMLSIVEIASGQQRVVPGVNPQHYQQVPVQQQYQHPPPPQYQQHNQQQMHMAPGVNPQQYQQQQQQQHQQQNVQYQQVPVQQQQQQHPPQQMHQQQQMPPQGQPPHQQQQQQQQQHPPQQHHGHHGQPQQVLHAGNMDQERAHIQEHMQVPIDTSKMSEAELQFHYFKMHDSDNNNKLDGCELIKSLIHWHAEEKNPKKPEEGAGTGEREGKIYTDQALSDVIDYVLKSMDFNNDGYVDYAEYRRSEEGQSKETKNN